MEIDRPFRINPAFQNKPENSRKIELDETNQKPLNEQLKDGIEDLERKTIAFREQLMSPNLIEKRCQEFEKEWAAKLESSEMKHLAEGMKVAVDAIRNEEKPSVIFVVDEKAAFKLTAEATRRLSQNRTRDDEKEM